jgi:hypothetical protein
MIPATLVIGASARARESAIAGALQGSLPAAVILEGMPDGLPVLHESPQLLLARIAAGCVCCTGNLVLRVTLNRLLQRAPSQLFIALANHDHLQQIRDFLSAPPYDMRLSLTGDLHA